MQNIGHQSKVAVWPTSMGDKIASMWHNPDELIASEGWHQLGGLLRQQAKEFPICDSPEAIDNTGLVWVGFPSKNHTIQVSSRVERFPDGDCIKHVIISIPCDDLPTARQLVLEVSLAVEPDQPAFCFGEGKGPGYLYHLFWPKDWNKSVVDMLKKWGDIGTPLWSSPMFTVVKGYAAKGLEGLSDTFPPDMQYGVVTPGKFQSKLMQTGCSGWHRTLVQNLKLIALAELFLNKFRGRDLFQYEIVKGVPDEFVKAIGRPFFEKIFSLIKNRLGPCTQCGFSVCREYVNDSRIIEPNELRAVMDCTDVSRQFGMANVWPLARDWCFLESEYICLRCKGVHKKRSLFYIQDPAPGLPDGRYLEAAIPENFD